MNKTVTFRFWTLSLILFFAIIQLNSQTIQRIVSLAPSLTHNLYLLKANDRIVGRTNYCIIDEKDKIPVVASAIKVNLEKVIAQQPDLVLVTSLTNIETVQLLENAGINVKYFPLPKSLVF